MNQNEMIVELVESVAECLCGEFELTNDGVPRIIFQGKDFAISVVYVAHSQQWKAFYPFPAMEQSKAYFPEIKELIRWLLDMGVHL